MVSDWMVVRTTCISTGFLVGYIQRYNLSLCAVNSLTLCMFVFNILEHFILKLSKFYWSQQNLSSCMMVWISALACTKELECFLNSELLNTLFTQFFSWSIYMTSLTLFSCILCFVNFFRLHQTYSLEGKKHKWAFF